MSPIPVMKQIVQMQHYYFTNLFQHQMLFLQLNYNVGCLGDQDSLLLLTKMLKTKFMTKISPLHFYKQSEKDFRIKIF